MVPGRPLYPLGLKEVPPVHLDQELELKEAVEKFYLEEDAASDNHMVETFSANCPDEPLGIRVLPG